MKRITLYSKAGCHLCDEARTLLEDLLADHPEYLVTLDEIDIRKDATTFERYRYRIPVIAIDDIETLEGRIAPTDMAVVRAALAE